jgi:hypothetical protein
METFAKLFGSLLARVVADDIRELVRADAAGFSLGPRCSINISKRYAPTITCVLSGADGSRVVIRSRKHNLAIRDRWDGWTVLIVREERVCCDCA